MRHKFGSLLILLISFCGGSEISNNEALISSTVTIVTDLTTTTVTDSTTTSSTSTTTAVPLSQTESYAQNNTLDQLVSTEMWNLFDADPPKSIYPEDLRRIEVLQTKLSDIYPEVQITSIYDEQTYQYHEKYCKEYNITECSLPYISDEHSYVTTTTTTQPQDTNGEVTNDNFNLSFQINVNQRNANCKIREYVKSINIPVKQYFEEIGWDKPKDIEEAEICFLFSNDISDEFIKHHNEFHNILFDYLGAYDRYVHYVYTKSEEDNTDALKILNKLGVYGSTANTVDDFFNRQSCLGGFSIFDDHGSGISGYSFCNQADPFIYTPWIAEEEDTTIAYYELMHGWAHEYYHHFQGKFVYGRALAMDTDCCGLYKPINAGAWHTEGAAIVFPNLLFREIYDDLSLTIDNNYPQPERTDNNLSLPDKICSKIWCDWEGAYFEVKQHFMGQGTYDEGDVRCLEMSSLEDYRDTWSCGIAGAFIANMYLAYITSFETMFFGILADSYETSFPESFEKNVGMSLDEFYIDFNNFMREGNIDDPPPPGFFPTEPLSKLVNFKK